MQFQRDNLEISKWFFNIQPQDHLIIVLKPSITYMSLSNNFCNENDVLHIIVSSIDNQLYESKLIGQIIGGTTFKCTTDTGKWNQTFSITAIYSTSSWFIQFNICSGFANYCRESHINAISDIVVMSGKKSLPTMCAAACAKRADRVEKATFSALLARRFGNTLANDFTEMMFPGIDKCATDHSLLNKLLLK
jgi:hypothetical protein